MSSYQQGRATWFDSKPLNSKNLKTTTTIVTKLLSQNFGVGCVIPFLTFYCIKDHLLHKLSIFKAFFLISSTQVLIGLLLVLNIVCWSVYRPSLYMAELSQSTILILFSVKITSNFLWVHSFLILPISFRSSSHSHSSYTHFPDVFLNFPTLCSPKYRKPYSCR